MNPQVARAFHEVGVITVGREFQNVSKIVNTIVDRGRGEKEHLFFTSAFLMQILLQLAVACGRRRERRIERAV
jgi:hypothetical protein